MRQIVGFPVGNRVSVSERTFGWLSDLGLVKCDDVSETWLFYNRIGDYERDGISLSDVKNILGIGKRKIRSGDDLVRAANTVRGA